jgi:hypothetical protein
MSFFQNYPLNPNLNDNLTRLSGGCGCGQNYQLGELTDAEVQSIVTTHFKSLPTTKIIAIATESANGNFNTIANEVRLLQTKICTYGAKDKVADFVSKNFYYLIAGLVVGGILLMRK